VRKRDPQHDVEDLLRDEVAEADDGPRAVPLRRLRGDRLDLDVLGRDDLELGVLRFPDPGSEPRPPLPVRRRVTRRQVRADRGDELQRDPDPRRPLEV
jgi:hypothetical protein